MRISFDVEPAHAREAFQLFATPGTQSALAALRDGSFLEQSATVDDLPEKQAVGQHKHLIHNEKSVSTKPKMGDACLLAVQLCKEPQFWEWVELEAGLQCQNDRDARNYICWVCGVVSRKDIDGNPSALNFWYQNICKPYRDYQTKQKQKS